MKMIEKYVDEISGRIFSKRKDAIKSEKKNGGIKKLFEFWKHHPEDPNCDFANGKWCYQRTDVEYLRLIDSFVKGIKDYEPWIAEKYEGLGGLQRVHIKGGYIIGRYLDDGMSEMDVWYRVIANICPQCFREWGQQYHANHCSHIRKPEPLEET